MSVKRNQWVRFSMVNTRQTSFLRLASFFLTEHFVLACCEAFLFDLSYSTKCGSVPNLEKVVPSLIVVARL